ncbi:MAG: family 10 glycosylhydrolase [Ignavibacteriales bacterium]|nr:family 10 glycosylhydrolase [Ignavibacteriales bacterium]
MKRFAIYIIVASSISLAFAQAPPKRELRAAWVATVANIDWPRDRNAPATEQVFELIQLFDALEEAGINAVFFQVRTEADALYMSPHEPWSYWLTGEQGTPPDPFFDPLAYAVELAHQRNMELHAWFNPYRAAHDVAKYEAARSHVTKRRPDLTLKFGDYRLLDPGSPEVRRIVKRVVADVVTRYDVDGVHFDDYFYPYDKIESEDSLSFDWFGGETLDVDDWRRHNVNRLMAELYAAIKSVKPRVKFGISPFGIVKNEYAGTDGFDSYEILYCDPLTWINDRTIDYVNPQLYWKIGHERADFAKLLPWWASVKGARHLYVGLYASKMAREDYEDPAMLGKQLRMTRAIDGVDGVVYFSAKAIGGNWNGLADSMRTDWFAYPSFPPTAPWLDALPPKEPFDPVARPDSASGGARLSWGDPRPAEDGEKPYYYVVYSADDRAPNVEDPRDVLRVLPPGKRGFVDADYEEGRVYLVSAFDRLHNESAPVKVRFLEDE